MENKLENTIKYLVEQSVIAWNGYAQVQNTPEGHVSLEIYHTLSRVANTFSFEDAQDFYTRRDAALKADLDRRCKEQNEATWEALNS